MCNQRLITDPLPHLQINKFHKGLVSHLNSDCSFSHSLEFLVLQNGSKPALDGDDRRNDLLVQPVIQLQFLAFPEKDFARPHLVIVSIQVQG